MSASTLPFIRSEDLTNVVHAAVIDAGAYAPEWMVDTWLKQARYNDQHGLKLGGAGFRVDPAVLAGALVAEIRAIESGEQMRACVDCGARVVPNWYTQPDSCVANTLCDDCNARRWSEYLATLGPVSQRRPETWGT